MPKLAHGREQKQDEVLRGILGRIKGAFMTNEKIMTVSEIFDLCMQINKIGKNHVFFWLFPHTSSIGIEIYKGQWKKSGEYATYTLRYNKTYSDFWNKSSVKAYKEVVVALKKILKEDMSNDFKEIVRFYED